MHSSCHTKQLTCIVAAAADVAVAVAAGMLLLCCG